MRGVGYATIESITLVLLAAIIGFLIGWILRRFLYNVDLSEYEARVNAADAQRRSALASAAAVEERLDVANNDLGSFQAKLAEVESKSVSLVSDLDASKSLVAQRDSRIEGLESELAGLRAEAAEASEAAAGRDARIEGLESELAGLRADLDAALAAGSEKEAAVGRLEAELAAAGAVQAESEARAARIAELEILVVEKEGAADADHVAALEAKLAAARQEVDACASRVAEREARIAELESAPADIEPVGVTGARDGDAPWKVDAVAAMAEIATRTAGGGPTVDDDLKKIHGVGPKLERLLKGMAITSFRQVARFEASDIAVVTAALDAFPGRIERDDWMSSAADEHRKKYGDDA